MNVNFEVSSNFKWLAPLRDIRVRCVIVHIELNGRTHTHTLEIDTHRDEYRFVIILADSNSGNDDDDDDI